MSFALIYVNFRNRSLMCSSVFMTQSKTNSQKNKCSVFMTFKKLPFTILLSSVATFISKFKNDWLVFNAVAVVFQPFKGWFVKQIIAHQKISFTSEISFAVVSGFFYSVCEHDIKVHMSTFRITFRRRYRRNI